MGDRARPAIAVDHLVEVVAAHVRANVVGARGLTAASSPGGRRVDRDAAVTSARIYVEMAGWGVVDVAADVDAVARTLERDPVDVLLVLLDDGPAGLGGYDGWLEQVAAVMARHPDVTVLPITWQSVGSPPVDAAVRHGIGRPEAWPDGWLRTLAVAAGSATIVFVADGDPHRVLQREAYSVGLATVLIGPDDDVAAAVSAHDAAGVVVAGDVDPAVRDRIFAAVDGPVRKAVRIELGDPTPDLRDDATAVHAFVESRTLPSVAELLDTYVD